MAPPLSISEQIRNQWARLSGLPGGKKLFSMAIGRMAPYTGTVGAVVDELEPGYAKVLLKDRKKVRNHLRSVHAVALVNLGEVATGLAVMSGMPDDARGILKGLAIEYHKKARGLLTAECRTEIPSTSERREYIVEGSISNEDGEVVATVQATWLIGPIPSEVTQNESSSSAA
ncbi:MAG: hotdog fold domain-containing protein [Myxococcota bacterium]|nr:hotdog fold domain-containing protein [Myxococcota bacterium]